MILLLKWTDMVGRSGMQLKQCLPEKYKERTEKVLCAPLF